MVNQNTSLLECPGIVVDETRFGQCFCQCEVHLHLSEGIPTIIGEIIGIHISNVGVYCYTLCVLLIILMIFNFFYPFWEKIDHFLKRSLKIFSKMPKFGEQMYQFLLLVEIPESGMNVIVGMVFGLFLRYTGLENSLKFDELLFFNTEVVFLFLIPPLILNTAFYFEKVMFIKNLVLILSHAVFGTLTNMVLLGLSLLIVFYQSYDFLDCFIFAALISAIDPVSVITIFHQKKVNERIDVLVEGESILNDAVAIVVFTMFKSLKLNVTRFHWEIIPLALGKFFYVLFVGFFIGAGCGLSASYFLKFSLKPKSLTSFQILVVIFFGFLSYLLSESLFSSGIFAIMICGIVMSHYLKYRLTEKVKISLKNCMKILSRICEGLIFLFLGIGIVIFIHEFNWAFIILSNIFIFIYRFIIVFTISVVYNVYKAATKQEILPWKEIFVQAFSGIRGAVSFALAFTIPDCVGSKGVIITTTTSVVIFTTFFQSSLLSSIVYALKIEKKKLPLEKKIKKFDDMRESISKIIIFIPIEHIYDNQMSEMNENLLNERKKVLLIRETNKNFKNLKNLVDDGLEMRIGEHEFQKLEKKMKNGIEMLDIKEKGLDLKEAFSIEGEDLKLIKDMYIFLCTYKSDIEISTGKKNLDDEILKSAKKIKYLLEFRDRISTLNARLHQKKYALHHTDTGIEKHYSKWVLNVFKTIDKAIQYIVQDENKVWREDRIFIRNYFKYKNYIDIHQFEHIATKHTEHEEIKRSLSQLPLREQSRTFTELMGEMELERKEQQKTQRLKQIRGTIKNLQGELKELNIYVDPYPGIKSDDVIADDDDDTDDFSIHIDGAEIVEEEKKEDEIKCSEDPLRCKQKTLSVDDLEILGHSPSITEFSEDFFKEIREDLNGQKELPIKIALLPNNQIDHIDVLIFSAKRSEIKKPDESEIQKDDDEEFLIDEF